MMTCLDWSNKYKRKRALGETVLEAKGFYIEILRIGLAKVNPPASFQLQGNYAKLTYMSKPHQSPIVLLNMSRTIRQTPALPYSFEKDGTAEWPI